MADDLKPCPFCGGPASANMEDGIWRVRCARCGTSSGFNRGSWFNTRAQRVAEWNKRVPESGQ